MKMTCTKTYSDIPFAHRQHKHKGHCAMIHGHNWAFTFVFAANFLDENGFVIDFGDLKWLKKWIDDNFDHKLLLNQDDPYGEDIDWEIGGDLADIKFVPNCGAEGLALYLYNNVNALMSINPEITKQNRGIHVISVTVHEDSKNIATVSF